MIYKDFLGFMLEAIVVVSLTMVFTMLLSGCGAPRLVIYYEDGSLGDRDFKIESRVEGGEIIKGVEEKKEGEE